MEVPSGPYLKAILAPPDSILILGGCCMTLEYPHENKNQTTTNKKQQPKAKQTNKEPLTPQKGKRMRKEKVVGPKPLRSFCCSVPGVMLLDSSRKGLVD